MHTDASSAARRDPSHRAKTISLCCMCACTPEGRQCTVHVLYRVSGTCWPSSQPTQARPDRRLKCNRFAPPNPRLSRHTVTEAPTYPFKRRENPTSCSRQAHTFSVGRAAKSVQPTLPRKKINFQEANRGGGGAVAQLQASPQETVCCTAENPALSSKLDRSKSNNTYTRGMRRFAPQATSFSYIKPRCFKCNTSVPHNPRDLTKAGIRFVYVSLNAHGTLHSGTAVLLKSQPRKPRKQHTKKTPQIPMMVFACLFASLTAIRHRQTSRHLLRGLLSFDFVIAVTRS